MNRDLFLAILALDSYNRGYSQRIGFESNSDAIGTRIGTAEITKTSNIDPESDARKADFYAQSYSWNGQTVISYRGTDNIVQDANAGYALGAGDGDAVISSLALGKIMDKAFGTDFGLSEDIAGDLGLPVKSQGTLAKMFYAAVTNQDVHDARTPANVVAVGHSLGGGLAGYAANDNAPAERLAA